MEGFTTEGLLRLVMLLPVFVPAIVIHEYAHAWMAYRCGDTTAKDMGRLTLDPIVHFDPLGSLMFVISSLSGIGFGWAKPVPVRFANLHNPLRDMVKVAAAGPATNVLQAICWTLILFVVRLILGRNETGRHFFGALTGVPQDFAGFFVWVAVHGALTNLLLVMFNLIPIPPLDGGRIAVGILPHAQARFVAQLESIGPLIVLVLLMTGVFSHVFMPVELSALRLIARILV